MEFIVQEVLNNIGNYEVVKVVVQEVLKNEEYVL